MADKDKLWEIGYKIIEIGDDAVDKIFDLFVFLWNLTLDLAAWSVYVSDKILDKIDWWLSKMAVYVARRIHKIRMAAYRNRTGIVNFFALVLITGTGLVGILASQVDYQYSYNGRTLGVVREQRDVLEVLDLISEELSVEYGTNIVIDPETDIEFKRVFSSGMEIDDADEVLQRFTYMGDLQVEAYAIYKGSERLCIVESEAVAKSVLQEMMNEYMKDDDAEYISVSFAEEVEILPFDTKLANVGSKANALKTLKQGAQKEEKYEVVSGDTLSGICVKLGVSMKELLEMNPDLDKNDVLHIGQKIITQVEVPLLTIRTEEISTFAEKIKYDTIEKESDNYYQGETVVARAGQYGKQKVTARLYKENGEIVDREDIEVTVITEPVDKIVYVGTKEVPPKKGTGTFIRPVNVSVYRGYGMRWGRMHYGLDYAASTGTAIHASDGGTVIAAGWSGAYGYRVTIDHGGNFTSLYAHCSKIYVSVGDKVYQGQTIAAVGNTGRSTGPHCHFEIKKNGVNVNPANYVS